MVTVPSPQDGVAENKGLLGPFAAQAPLTGVSALFVRVMAPRLIVPPKVNGVAFPLVKRLTPVGRVRNPKRLPRAIRESKLPCS